MAQGQPELWGWGTDEGEIKVSGERSVISFQVPAPGLVVVVVVGGDWRQPPSLGSARGNGSSVGPGALCTALSSVK